LAADAKRLIELRAALAEWEGRAGAVALSMARRSDEEDVFIVPRAEFDAWFAQRGG
jgi:hypothetical protein